MKVLLRLSEGEVLEVELANGSLVSDLKGKIPNDSKLFVSDKELVDTDVLSEDMAIELQVNLMGGAGSSDIPEHLRELAMKYRCNKMICRKCYARLPMGAHNCRKRKCGHCANIRPKKKIKEKEKGK